MSKEESAAMSLNPPSFINTIGRAPVGYLGSIEAFLYQRILVPNAVIISHVEPAPVPKIFSLAERNAKIKAIMEQPPPAAFALTDPLMWKEQQEKQVSVVKAAYADRGLIDDEAASAEGGGGVSDPFLPLLLKLRDELVRFGDFLQKMFDAKVADSAFNPYGGELQMPPTDASLAFWPSKAGEWPILFYCAKRVLAGDSNSTCFNERMHSPMGRITSKFRASMKAVKTEKLTMSYFLMRERIQIQVDKNTTIITELDSKELEEERLGAVSQGLISREEAGFVDEDGVIDLA